MPAYRSAGISAHRYEKDDDCLYKQVSNKAVEYCAILIV